jgi:hypothetical protein
MRWFEDCKIRSVLPGLVVSLVVGTGSAHADFTFGEPTNLASLAGSGAA